MSALRPIISVPSYFQVTLNHNYSNSLWLSHRPTKGGRDKRTTIYTDPMSKPILVPTQKGFVMLFRFPPFTHLPHVPSLMLFLSTSNGPYLPLLVYLPTQVFFHHPSHLIYRTPRSPKKLVLVSSQPQVTLLSQIPITDYHPIWVKLTTFQSNYLVPVVVIYYILPYFLYSYIIFNFSVRNEKLYKQS